MGNTRIEWATKVWNPVTGCTKVSPGCDNCYAERMSKRFVEPWGLDPDDPFKVTLHPNRLEEPLRWKKPARIFVCSMGDLFHNDVPDDFIWDVFNKMSNAQWINGHTFIVLTKRPERMLKIIKEIEANILEQRKPIRNDDGTTSHKLTFSFPLQNIWLGVTAENQEQADKRIPILLQIPAAVRFVSVEPMLSAVEMRFGWMGTGPGTCLHRDQQGWIGGIDWVICGGESGPGARPMHPDWVRGLRDQCQAAGVPFLFKQQGEWSWDLSSYNGPKLPPEKVHWIWPDGIHKQVGCGEVSPGSVMTHRVGKKKSGRLLDGREWDEYPAGVGGLAT